MSCWSNGMLCTTLPWTLSWIVARRAMAQSTERQGSGPPAPDDLRPPHVEQHHGQLILLGIVAGLGVGLVFEFDSSRTWRA